MRLTRRHLPRGSFFYFLADGPPTILPKAPSRSKGNGETKKVGFAVMFLFSRILCVCGNVGERRVFLFQKFRSLYLFPDTAFRISYLNYVLV